MSVINYIATREAFDEADKKVQRYSTLEADRPDISTLNDGDIWFNEDTAREMIVIDGTYIEAPTSPASAISIEESIEESLSVVHRAVWANTATISGIVITGLNKISQ